MDWVGIVVAGLAATAVITMLMYAGPVMGMLRMDIAQLLGSMVLPQGSAAFAMGMMVHFMMGIIFAMMMPVHKEVRAGRLSSPLAAGPKGMMGLLLGHLVFGLVVALVYRPFVV
jgi:hypothetical protein